MYLTMQLEQLMTRCQSCDDRQIIDVAYMGILHVKLCGFHSHDMPWPMNSMHSSSECKHHWQQIWIFPADCRQPPELQRYSGGVYGVETVAQTYLVHCCSDTLCAASFHCLASPCYSRTTVLPISIASYWPLRLLCSLFPLGIPLWKAVCRIQTINMFKNRISIQASLYNTTAPLSTYRARTCQTGCLILP